MQLPLGLHTDGSAAQEQLPRVSTQKIYDTKLYLENVRGHCPLKAAFSLIRRPKHHKNRLHIISKGNKAPVFVRAWCVNSAITHMLRKSTDGVSHDGLSLTQLLAVLWFETYLVLLLFHLERSYTCHFIMCVCVHQKLTEIKRASWKMLKIIPGQHQILILLIVWLVPTKLDDLCYTLHHSAWK